MKSLFVSACCALLAMAAQAQPMSRGAYLARLGDCTSCHTLPGGKPFAGGFPVNSPFGVIYGANITPDPEYGIGKYSLKNFKRAVRQGITPDGEHLYPAMPYPSFAKMSDDDLKALYDYFMHEVVPVHAPAPETHLMFPFNQRWGLRFWDWMFAGGDRYLPKKEHDKEWNRGAYIVQSPGHCGACHTPRGPAYEERGQSESSSTFLSGGLLDHWFAPPLSADHASGLGRWSEKDIADFLATGRGAGTVAFGSMKEVVENSGQYMTPQDRAAVAHYLKSLPPSGEEAAYDPNAGPDVFERPGAGLYAAFCSKCHGATGEGRLPRVPKLTGNSAVLGDNPSSVIRIILEGSASPQIPPEMKPAVMPAFAHRFTDREIADAANFIRRSWGNHAPAVTERDVKKLRQALANEPPIANIPSQASSTRQ